MHSNRLSRGLIPCLLVVLLAAFSPGADQSPIPKAKDDPTPTPVPTPTPPADVVPNVPTTLTATPGQILQFEVESPIGQKLLTVKSWTKSPKTLFNRFEPVTTASTITYTYMFETTVPGTYVVTWIYKGQEKGVSTTITVENTTPPAPTPTPTPVPGPGPTPGTAPFSCTGLHVLITYNPLTATKNLTADQESIITGSDVRSYLNSATPMEGDQHAWVIFQSSADVSGEPKVWQDAFGVKRDKDEWIVISNGKTGYSGPLPANVAAVKALVDQYK